MYIFFPIAILLEAKRPMENIPFLLNRSIHRAQNDFPDYNKEELEGIFWEYIGKRQDESVLHFMRRILSQKTLGQEIWERDAKIVREASELAERMSCKDILKKMDAEPKRKTYFYQVGASHMDLLNLIVNKCERKRNPPSVPPCSPFSIPQS